MNQCRNGATEKTANRDNRPKTIEQKGCLKNSQKYAFGKYFNGMLVKKNCTKFSTKTLSKNAIRKELH